MVTWYMIEKREAAGKGNCKHSPCVDILEYAIWQDISEEEKQDYIKRMKKCGGISDDPHVNT